MEKEEKSRFMGVKTPLRGPTREGVDASRDVRSCAPEPLWGAGFACLQNSRITFFYLLG